MVYREKNANQSSRFAFFMKLNTLVLLRFDTTTNSYCGGLRNRLISK